MDEKSWPKQLSFRWNSTVVVHFMTLVSRNHAAHTEAVDEAANIRRRMQYACCMERAAIQGAFMNVIVTGAISCIDGNSFFTSIPRHQAIEP
ncbi:hypothetical protein ISN76_04700 [Dyella halodurans]|uniref:Uncharacterized protein n=1 Tax=Dyella halodurans TaxID=1920171 RepID=A0ABV9C186_9GAMM|nr:hypothetical protein [Dyella halodurans]